MAVCTAPRPARSRGCRVPVRGCDAGFVIDQSRARSSTRVELRVQRAGNRAALRAKRLAQLEELNKASGPALSNGPLQLTHMGEVEEAVASIKMHRVADGAVDLAEGEEEEMKQGAEGRRLNFPISCY